MTDKPDHLNRLILSIDSFVDINKLPANNVAMTTLMSKLTDWQTLPTLETTTQTLQSRRQQTPPND